MNSQIVPASDRQRLAAFAALGAAQAVVYGVLSAWDGHLDRPSIAMLMALLAFALYLAALALARPLSGRRALAVAVVLGLLFRVLLLPEPPFLSDDYFRYMWDGLVQLRGVNPYRYAPADPALAGLNDALRAQVNHPEIRTIYPPLAQLVFALAALLAEGSWLLLKVVWLACDVAIALLLYRLVPEGRRLQAWTLYWWSPLVIIEVAWNAHLDALGVLFVIIALALARPVRLRSAGVGLAIAAAALVKYFALAFLPAAARAGRPLRVVAAFIIGLALLSAPYASAGRYMFEGLLTYAQAWQFNDGLYRLLVLVVASPNVAKMVAAAIVLLIVVNSVRNEWSLERTVFWVTGAILMLSPTVHPWYLLWMVPLLALRPNRGWLYLSGSVFLAYYGLAAYRAEGVWPEPWWIRLSIYGPFLILLVVDGWRGSWWQAAWEAVRIGRRPRAARADS